MKDTQNHPALLNAPVQKSWFLDVMNRLSQRYQEAMDYRAEQSNKWIPEAIQLGQEVNSLEKECRDALGDTYWVNFRKGQIEKAWKRQGKETVTSLRHIIQGIKNDLKKNSNS